MTPTAGSSLADRGLAFLGAGGAVLAWWAPEWLLRTAPGCIWERLGIHYCWGCGITRGLVELMHGNLRLAIQENVASPWVALLLAVYLLQQVRRVHRAHVTATDCL